VLKITLNFKKVTSRLNKKTIVPYYFWRIITFRIEIHPFAIIVII